MPCYFDDCSNINLIAIDQLLLLNIDVFASTSHAGIINEQTNIDVLCFSLQCASNICWRCSQVKDDDFGFY